MILPDRIFKISFPGYSQIVAVMKYKFRLLSLIKFSKFHIVAVEGPRIFSAAFRTNDSIVGAMLSYHVCETRVTLGCFVTRSLTRGSNRAVSEYTWSRVSRLSSS